MPAPSQHNLGCRRPKATVVSSAADEAVLVQQWSPNARNDIQPGTQPSLHDADRDGHPPSNDGNATQGANTAEPDPARHQAGGHTSGVEERNGSTGRWMQMSEEKAYRSPEAQGLLSNLGQARPPAAGTRPEGNFSTAQLQPDLERMKTADQDFASCLKTLKSRRQCKLRDAPDEQPAGSAVTPQEHLALNLQQPIGSSSGKPTALQTEHDSGQAQAGPAADETGADQMAHAQKLDPVTNAGSGATVSTAEAVPYRAHTHEMSPSSEALLPDKSAAEEETEPAARAPSPEVPELLDLLKMLVACCRAGGPTGKRKSAREEGAHAFESLLRDLDRDAEHNVPSDYGQEDWGQLAELTAEALAHLATEAADEQGLELGSRTNAVIATLNSRLKACRACRKPTMEHINKYANSELLCSQCFLEKKKQAYKLRHKTAAQNPASIAASPPASLDGQKAEASLVKPSSVNGPATGSLADEILQDNSEAQLTTSAASTPAAEGTVVQPDEQQQQPLQEGADVDLEDTQVDIPSSDSGRDHGADGHSKAAGNPLSKPSAKQPQEEASNPQALASPLAFEGDHPAGNDSTGNAEDVPGLYAEEAALNQEPGSLPVRGMRASPGDEGMRASPQGAFDPQALDQAPDEAERALHGALQEMAAAQAQNLALALESGNVYVPAPGKLLAPAADADNAQLRLPNPKGQQESSSPSGSLEAPQGNASGLPSGPVSSDTVGSDDHQEALDAGGASPGTASDLQDVSMSPAAAPALTGNEYKGRGGLSSEEERGQTAAALHDDAAADGAQDLPATGDALETTGVPQLPAAERAEAGALSQTTRAELEAQLRAFALAR